MRRTFTCKPSGNIKAATEVKKQSIKAATADEMIDAFEERIAELSVETKTDVSCSDDIDREKERSVEILDSDNNIYYIDVEGGFGEPNAKYSLAEIKDYWNRENIGDPILEGYDNYEDWWIDTLNNFLKEA